MGEKGEGSGGKGGGKWGERGRELGMGYPPVHPLLKALTLYMVVHLQSNGGTLRNEQDGELCDVT